MTDTHINTPTRFVEVDGEKLAYRRWGNTATAQPHLFPMQHFRGGMDHWDPLMTDGLAAGREVILFKGCGVASSSGTFHTYATNLIASHAYSTSSIGLNSI